MVLLFYTSIHSNRLQYLMVWQALRTSFNFASMASTDTPSGFSSAADMVWESCFNPAFPLLFSRRRQFFFKNVKRPYKEETRGRVKREEEAWPDAELVSSTCRRVRELLPRTLPLETCYADPLLFQFSSFSHFNILSRPQLAIVWHQTILPFTQPCI